MGQWPRPASGPWLMAVSAGQNRWEVTFSWRRPCLILTTTTKIVTVQLHLPSTKIEWECPWQGENKLRHRIASYQERASIPREKRLFVCRMIFVTFLKKKRTTTTALVVVIREDTLQAMGCRENQTMYYKYHQVARLLPANLVTMQRLDRCWITKVLKALSN